MSACAPLGRDALAARIDAALPQTQCTRCGYPDCASYARAVAAGEAGINQCPPGGAAGVERLAALTGRPVIALSVEHGAEAPRNVAVIDEAWCIGCTLCIKACPTDAILGANKFMHTVIAAHCTGCELCIPVCPVDCIELHNASGPATGWSAWSPQQAEHARQRYAAHRDRLDADRAKTAVATAMQEEKKLDGPSTPCPTPPATDSKQATIAAILARARAQRAGAGASPGTH
ncbi:Nitrogen fixation protein rnfB [Delftia tsuruhatensis]|uniref:RnfABCDGE type electron transport complex subunit B n=1 Tax=Delftia tsuruhatensis TaxID=180282 RepID=UPI001E74B87B|nr:RnfABCDGE type electron transport complex subunit B [Delftia tsuruhatensis]CAB5707487.1 Nitrogen fixation protein rnfB [Delftia tsuruhatensis]CAC9684915.1 Nitrogen fixation protein rnfB [Delftia tsuruhatensis]